MIFLNGRIFTGDPTLEWAQALAVSGGRVQAIGDSTLVRRRADNSTRIMDLQGRLVIPGINDSHAHLGSALPGLSFETDAATVPNPSLSVVLDSLKEAVLRAEEGTWLHTLVDARVLDDVNARRAALDSVAPRHPVWLAAVTGHGAILNSAALRALQLNDEVFDPVGGWYEREGIAFPGRGPGRGAGRLTGLLQEYAGWNAARRLRSMQSDNEVVYELRRAGQRAAELGVTTLQDLADAFDPGKTRAVLTAAQLPVRVRVIPMPATTSLGTETRGWEWVSRLDESATGPKGAMLYGGGMKWILDGTGIERLSLRRAEYADRRGWYGAMNFGTTSLRQMLRDMLELHQQPILHAIGDSTISIVLTTMERIAPDSVWRSLRPRIEHGEWLTKDLRARAAAKGIMVVENPSHFTDGAERMQERFGDPAPAGYQPLASLARDGVALALGSDGPLDPYSDLYFAVTHPDNPRERLTLADAVRAYTYGSAMAEGMEQRKGRLLPGMLADLAVLSQDIFAVPVENIPKTKSVLTMVGGEIVFDAKVVQREARTILKK